MGETVGKKDQHPSALKTKFFRALGSLKYLMRTYILP